MLIVGQNGWPVSAGTLLSQNTGCSSRAFRKISFVSRMVQHKTLASCYFSLRSKVSSCRTVSKLSSPHRKHMHSYLASLRCSVEQKTTYEREPLPWGQSYGTTFCRRGEAKGHEREIVISLQRYPTHCLCAPLALSQPEREIDLSRLL